MNRTRKRISEYPFQPLRRDTAFFRSRRKAILPILLALQ
jgi:hypothetical protein